MTKVWIVSGFVLIGTGLALAGFGAWLTGNSNCDATDLGRSCIAASLGVAVIGLCLAGAGWMRLKRMSGGAEGGGDGGGFLVRRPGIVVIAASVVGLILLSIALPGPQVPVNVYRAGAPAIETAPSVLIPATVGAVARTDLTEVAVNHSTVAEAGFGGGAFVRVTRFNALSNWTPPPPPMDNGTAEYNASRQQMIDNQSVGNATGSADLYLDAQYSALNPAQGGRECAKAYDRHWFVQHGAGRSVFTWRAGTFVFEVSAPTDALRNQIADAVSAPLA